MLCHVGSQAHARNARGPGRSPISFITYWKMALYLGSMTTQLKCATAAERPQPAEPEEWCWFLRQVPQPRAKSRGRAGSDGGIGMEIHGCSPAASSAA